MMSERFIHHFKHTMGPLLLILLCPPTVMLMWYTCTHLQGSLFQLGQLFVQKGIFGTILFIWKPLFFGSATAWKILGIYAAIQLFFMKAIPGPTFYGPITPKGNIPHYRANGPQVFSLTIALFFLSSFGLGFFPATIIYDHLGEILGALTLFSFLFCILLYLKGRFAPSSSDASVTGNVVFDFYWGTELYPRILSWDVKMFTNCRFAMMGWPLILLSYAAKQSELYGLSNSMIAAVLLQLIYVAKFFLWEAGYLRSLDIMHDRAGYYICWGCLVWVPGIYTSSTMYLVHHPNHLHPLFFLFILVVGTTSILANYFADRQRQKVRALDGNCKVWGKEPMFTMASYTTSNGREEKSILLASGWWGISRHFHYVPEILGAFFWTLPALFYSPLPYFYVVFLTILLLERAFRDDRRCAKKYGNDWKKHCEKVPYKIIPFII